MNFATTTDREHLDSGFRTAKKYARRFRRKGLDKASEHIVRGIETAGVSSKTVLEIGCGVGGLLLSLLKHGASSAIGVDVSEGMLEMAKKLAVESALGDRVKYLRGDYAAMNGEAPSADVVILDKVICCYAVSYPRNSLLGRSRYSGANFDKLPRGRSRLRRDS